MTFVLAVVIRCRECDCFNVCKFKIYLESKTREIPFPSFLRKLQCRLRTINVQYEKKFHEDMTFMISPMQEDFDFCMAIYSLAHKVIFRGCCLN